MNKTIVLRILLFCFLICNLNGQDINPLSTGLDTLVVFTDTIIKKKVDTLVITDTITSYWKLKTSAGYVFAKNNTKNYGDYEGYNFDLTTDYVRNRFFYSTGISFKSLKANTKFAINDTSTRLSLTNIDTIIVTRQLVNGLLIYDSIPTTLTVLDSVTSIGVRNASRQYNLRQLSIPLIFGTIYDKGALSALTGVGVKINYILPSSREYLVEQNGELITQQVNSPVNLSFLFNNQILFYAGSRVAFGTHIMIEYNPSDAYPYNTRGSITWSLGGIISIIL